MDHLLHQLVIGLTLGTPYALIASGFALVSGAGRAFKRARTDVVAVIGLVLVLAISELAASRMDVVRPSLSAPARELAVLLIGAAAIGGIAWLRRATVAGIAQRAVEQDCASAILLGVQVTTIGVVAVAMAAVSAAIGGALLALRGDSASAMPVSLGFAILSAAVLGGLGSIPGAIIAGILIGIADSVWTQTFGMLYRDTALFVIMVLFLIFRPAGVLGRAAAERI